MLEMTPFVVTLGNHTDSVTGLALDSSVAQDLNGGSYLSYCHLISLHTTQALKSLLLSCSKLSRNVAPKIHSRQHGTEKGGSKRLPQHPKISTDPWRADRTNMTKIPPFPSLTIQTPTGFRVCGKPVPPPGRQGALARRLRAGTAQARGSPTHLPRAGRLGTRLGPPPRCAWREHVCGRPRWAPLGPGVPRRLVQRDSPAPQVVARAEAGRGGG